MFIVPINITYFIFKALVDDWDCFKMLVRKKNHLTFKCAYFLA